MKISLRYIANNLRYKKLRTVLTVISIAIGVFSVVIISAISQIGKQAMNYELDSLGIGGIILSTKANTAVRMGSSDIEAVKNIPSVEAATPVMMNVSYGIVRNNSTDIALWGVNSDAADVIRIETAYGRLINENDVAECANVCVIDKNLALENYKRENIVGKTVKLLVGSSYESFEVVGVVSSGGNVLQGLAGGYIPTFVYIPYTTMQMYNKDLSIENLAVKFKENSDIESDATSIINSLEIKNSVVDVYKYDNIAQQKETLNKMLDIVTAVLAAIAFVSIIVAGIGIMTVMMVAVSERTHEIGIKKAVGARKLQIMAEFITESFAISLIGSVIGGFGGELIAFILSNIAGMPVNFNLKLVLLCIFGALVISVIFGIYPAFSAAKMKPADALKFE